MYIKPFHVRLLLIAALLASVVSVRATQLTFDIYSDSAKTTLIPQGSYIPLAYGDNVTDFDPAGPIGGQYFRYGTNGGYTPDISLEYGWIEVANPTTSHGLFGPQLWYSGYPGLTNVAYPVFGASYYNYIAFTPTAGVAKLVSFDVARYLGGSEGGFTLKVVQNAFTPTPQTLWAAAPDGGVTIGALTTYSPNVNVDPGSTLYLIFGSNGNLGLDNITFTGVPEPSAMLLAGLGALALGLRRRP
jgi:hypothetical protein